MAKQNVVYTYNEYYSASKRNEILIYTTSWMNLENITFRKTNIVRFCLYERPRRVQFIEAESRMLVTKGWERGNGKLLFNGYESFSLG